MPESVNKHCPRCGKRPIDRLVAQCPDCQVPFVADAPASGLSPAQLSAIAWQIFGSWKFWAGLALLVGLVAWGSVQVVQRSIDQRIQQAVSAQQLQDSNRFADADARISRQISNQISSQLRDPALRSTIEQVVADRAGDLLTNAVWASLNTFRKNLDLATAQLAQTTNDIAALSRDVRVSQRAASQIAPPADEMPALLRLVNQTVSHTGSNYILTLFFLSTTNKPVGAVDLVAGTYKQTARVLDFTARNVSDLQPAVMNDTGDAARLQFTANRVGVPVLVELDLSAPTIVKIMGDALEDEITLPVASEKMIIPPDTK